MGTVYNPPVPSHPREMSLKITLYCVNLELGGDQALEARTRVDASLARRFRLGARKRFSRVEASLAADNLLDRALYDQMPPASGGTPAACAGAAVVTA